MSLFPPELTALSALYLVMKTIDLLVGRNKNY